MFDGSGSSVLLYLVWGGEKAVLFFHPWLPKFCIFCPQIEAHQKLLTVFCIHVQRGSLGMSPIFLGYLHLTHPSLLEWHCLQTFGRGAKK